MWNCALSVNTGLSSILKLSFLLLTISSQVCASLWALLSLIKSQKTPETHQSSNSAWQPTPTPWLLLQPLIPFVLFCFAHFTLYFQVGSCTHVCSLILDTVWQRKEEGASMPNSVSFLNKFSVKPCTTPQTCQVLFFAFVLLPEWRHIFGHRQGYLLWPPTFGHPGYLPQEFCQFFNSELLLLSWIYI